MNNSYFTTNGGDITDTATIQLMAVILSCGISVVAFFKSRASTDSSNAANQAREIGRLEAKLDHIMSDIKDIKKQSQEANEKFETLFVWKSSAENRILNLEKR